MVIAVTGDIGAGKSTAAKLLAHKLSCRYINADEEAKKLWLRDDVKTQTVNRFGKCILDSHGNISIREISNLIFSDECSHEFVNKLIHPLVMSELERLSLEHDVVLEIPLLFEAGRREWIDCVIYAAAEFDCRVRRCELQRGWSVDELMRRERFLLPREKRIAMSDCVIQNDGSISELEEQIKEVGERLNERKRKKIGSCPGKKRYS